MATLHDVAAAAGVSVSAVSRVLTNSPQARVSEDTRRRIHEAAERLDYRPNFAARALKSSRTLVLALVMPDITNTLFTDLVRGVDEEAAAYGYRLLLARAEGAGSKEQTIRALIGEGRVDGVLLQADDSVSPEEYARLSATGLPIVFVNAQPSGVRAAVSFADDHAVYLAVQHLVELGHERIGFLGGLPSTDTAVRRLAGFRGAMAIADLPIDEGAVTHFGYLPSDGARALHAVRDLIEPPTAVVVANINAALGLLMETRELGIEVPHDLSLVAIHDAWTAEIVWRPLTTVKLPWYELGAASVRAMVKRLAGEELEPLVIRERAPELKIRESTAPPPQAQT